MARVPLSSFVCSVDLIFFFFRLLRRLRRRPPLLLPGARRRAPPPPLRPCAPAPKHVRPAPRGYRLTPAPPRRPPRDGWRGPGREPRFPRDFRPHPLPPPPPPAEPVPARAILSPPQRLPLTSEPHRPLLRARSGWSPGAPQRERGWGSRQQTWEGALSFGPPDGAASS